MGIKDVLSKMLKKDERLKQLQQEMKIRKMAEDRLKNSNERELEKYMEEERQKSIKKNLEEFRKARQEETWHGQNIFMTKDNMFKGKATMLQNNDKLLKMKSNNLSKGGMFFK